MERKNSILLTVIAIATLLVAVVGATFAYFTANVTNTAKVTSSVTTKARDVFNATGSGTMSITVNNDKMQTTNTGAVAATATNNSMTISLTAGSGKATCSYKLKLTKDTSSTAYTRTSTLATGVKEFTISGKDNSTTAQTFNETEVSDNLILGTFSISDTSATGAATQTWTFTTNFYNQNVDQNNLAGSTFSYSVQVVDVSCTNSAS